MSAGATATVDQVFALPDATLRITIQDESGTRIPGTQIYIASAPTSTGGVYYAGGDFNGEGELLVAVVSQLNWLVRAFSTRNEDGDETHMSSSQLTVSPVLGQTTDMPFTVKEVAHKLTINITTSDVP